MKRLKFYGCLASVAAALMTLGTTQAALQLTTTGPDSGSIDNAYFFNFATNPTEAQIAAALGVAVADLTPGIFKNDLPSTYSGALASSYTVTYAPPNGSGTATIDYVPNKPFFDTTKLTWLLAKDGSSGHYLWNLTGIWDGKEQIVINDLWPTTGSFSHVEIGGVAVPEPTTYLAGALLLLPFAASTLRIWRGRRTAQDLP